MSPADPRPATARPTISALEVGAAPHTADPISKITIQDLQRIRRTYYVHWFDSQSRTFTAPSRVALLQESDTYR